MAKQAKAVAAAFWLQCPHCESDVVAPDGSYLWKVDEQLPPEYDCDCCGKTFSVPANMGRARV